MLKKIGKTLYYIFFGALILVALVVAVSAFPAKGKRVPITHRITEVKNENGKVSYMTKGDANEEADGEFIPALRVVGKVLFSVPYVGYAIDTAKKPYGFLALVIIPALLIIWSQIENIWKEVKKMKTEKIHENN